MGNDDQGFMGFPSRADFQAMLEVVDRKRAQRLKDEGSAREARRLDLENQVIEAATRIYEAEKANSRATVIADALDELAGKLRAGWRLVPPEDVARLARERYERIAEEAANRLMYEQSKDGE